MSEERRVRFGGREYRRLGKTDEGEMIEDVNTGHRMPAPAADELETVQAEESDAGPEPADTVANHESLVTRAEELGISVDRRWGEQRLRQEISAAEDRDGI